MWPLGRPADGIPSGRSGWRRVPGRPMTRVGAALFAVGGVGWVATGIAGHAGWIEWPTATLAAGACMVPHLLHRTLFADDEDD